MGEKKTKEGIPKKKEEGTKTKKKKEERPSSGSGVSNGLIFII